MDGPIDYRLTSRKDANVSVCRSKIATRVDLQTDGKSASNKTYLPFHGHCSTMKQPSHVQPPLVSHLQIIPPIPRKPTHG